MFIPIPPQMLHSQNYDECLRFACNELSNQGIKNFIHYQPIRVVEFFDPVREMAVIIDHKESGILFVEQYLFNGA